MGYRSIFIQSAARVSMRRAQLLISTDAERQLPLEDVDCLLLEDPRSTVTAAALAACAEAGVTVFICDARHMPCGVFTPWNGHSRLYAHLPGNGSVRLLVITEKQYAAIEILVGRLSLEEETDFPCEQLSIF